MTAPAPVLPLSPPPALHLQSRGHWPYDEAATTGVEAHSSDVDEGQLLIALRAERASEVFARTGRVVGAWTTRTGED